MSDQAPTGNGRFRVVGDDDGHEYVIEADKRDEWEAWLLSDEAMDGGPLPPWATRLNMHRQNYSFTDWREDA